MCIGERVSGAILRALLLVPIEALLLVSAVDTTTFPDTLTTTTIGAAHITGDNNAPTRKK